MKLVLHRFNALPIDRDTLTMLPDGEVDVQIGLRCDQEAFARLMALFREVNAKAEGQAARALEPKEPKKLGP